MSARFLGARLWYWAALAFTVGYQVVGQPIAWRWL